jgi:F-type H+-transporting ATPase subunit b
VFFVVLAAVPSHATAQAPASSSAGPATAAAGQSGQPEEAKPEADEADVYLHAPAVKSMARMLHLDVETTARIFEGINFAIVALAVVFFIFRWLPGTLRKRSEKVSSDMETARKVTEEARTRLSAIETKLSGLDGEIAVIRARVEAESLEDEARIKSTISEESARIVAAAEQEVASTAAQARRALRRFAAELAIEQAVRDIVITPETDEALIAEFLGDVERKSAQQGGQN